MKYTNSYYSVTVCYSCLIRICRFERLYEIYQLMEEISFENILMVLLICEKNGDKNNR